jgi:hypothetical protein
MRRTSLLGQREPLPRCHRQLQLDEVEAGDHLGDRVLDLEPGVHLEEVVGRRVVGVDDELHRPHAAVAHRARDGDGVDVHALDHGGIDAGGGCLLDDLLVAALEAAVAGAQVHDVASAVADDLHLDVARAGDVALEQEGVVAEGRERLTAGRRERGLDLLGCSHHAHPLAAAAGRRLDDDGETDLGGPRCELGVVGTGAVEAGDDRDSQGRDRVLGRALVAHEADGRAVGSDEHQARRLARLGEVGVLGQEAVPGVHGLRTGAQRGADDRLDVEVGQPGLCRSEEHRLVGLADVQRIAIRLAEDGDRREAALPQRADHAAAISPRLATSTLVSTALTSGRRRSRRRPAVRAKQPRARDRGRCGCRPGR